MKSVPDILACIDALYEHWSTKPEMFAPDPRCLEHVFEILESLREFILSDDETLPPPSDTGYSQFIINKHPELGTWGFTTRNCEYRQPIGKDDGRVFSEFVDFWKTFLASSYRKKSVDGETDSVLGAENGVDS